RQVAVSARSAEALGELAGEVADGPGAIHPFALDVTDLAAARATAGDIEQILGPIRLAVLNAGTHLPVHATQLSAAPFRTLIEVNVMGTVHCLDAALGPMRARGEGHIAIVSSVAGYRGLPTASAYGLTKAGLINMAEALRPELERLGILLQVVNPGFVKTPLTDRNPFPMPFLMELETAARAFRRGLSSRRFEIVFPRRLAYALKVLRCLPAPLSFALTKRMIPTE
ncbi:MAG: SDR family NAD(P)-dependent oxidoreductase, partial [Caulobacterales bacterium]|nr:SDR family NAD(P)-dependent oxidoreductase [Caulobacterales bacterium]